MAETKQNETGTEIEPVGYIELLRNNRNFRLLWSSQVISLFGDWFNLIASASLTAMLTGSGVAVAGLFGIRMVSSFVASLFAGILTDRFNRKNLLIASDLVRSVILLGFLLIRDSGDVWLIYALTGLQFALSGLFFPARNAMLPDVTAPNELGTANALMSITWSTLLALGTAIGGLVAGYFGVYTAFVVDALTYLVSAVILYRVVYEHKPLAQTHEGENPLKSVLEDYLDGLRYLRQNLDMFFIALHKTAVSLFVYIPYQVFHVAVAENVFVVGENGNIGLGLMYATVGLGTGLGPIFARIFTGDDESKLRWAIAVSYLFSIGGMLITAPLLSFPLFLLGSFIRALGTGTAWVFSTHLLLANLPEEVRGRVLATEYGLFTVMGALGAMAAGYGLDIFNNITLVIIGFSILTILPTAGWFWWVGVHARPAVADAMGNRP